MAEPKKQVPLRLNAKLYNALAAWAEDDFRSVNGQIEYLLTECVRQRKKNGKYVSDQLDVPPELISIEAPVKKAFGALRRARQTQILSQVKKLVQHLNSIFAICNSTLLLLH